MKLWPKLGILEQRGWFICWFRIRLVCVNSAKKFNRLVNLLAHNFFFKFLLINDLVSNWSKGRVNNEVEIEKKHIVERHGQTGRTERRRCKNANGG